ncbi:acyl carrier protein [Streptomyces sp. DSM 42041]|uniref:Acyl carrier protein n=1 Tax=Streptomyces hazeniae TaxID=3075538 RepID=A0ABU2NYT3_9ACTN|nr:acyl carrier protein [Streptomyces sp. DSM 42041]MDT0382152.1 acyl carrier protein [Streptomyces sp. DSM 42041]
MPSTSVNLQQLRALPKTDREMLLESIVLRTFREHLFLEDSDDLSVEENYFDLGLTSLQLTEVKEHIEHTFECEVDTTLLFNDPTIAQLLEHLDELITQNGGSRQ